MNGKKKFKKFLVLNITLVFVTVSMMNNVVGFVNNENGININYSNKDIENDLSTGINYEIITAGHGSVEYLGPGIVNLDMLCDPDSEYNISISGPDLILIFLLRTTISLRYNPLIPLVRIAGYSMYIEIDGVPRSDTSRMKIVEPGSKSNILGVGYLLKNACNQILKITIRSSVYSIFPFRFPEISERTIMLNVKCIQ